MIKKIIFFLFFILIVIQFFRPKKNISISNSEIGITSQYLIPENVQEIFKQSCNDCHSDTTSYPWYFVIQPVAWWMQDHVNEGKRELNFSQFASYPPKKQFHKMKSIAEQIKGGEMPLNSYLWIHRDSKLSEDQKALVIKWADSLALSIKTINNLPDEPQHHRD